MTRHIADIDHVVLGQGILDSGHPLLHVRVGPVVEERRAIEQGLFQENLLGVVSTSALELGIDVGGLDACLLVGYPGSIASTWQRAGRVGRAGQQALIILVALPDALDQYFMRHPEDFFARRPEAAVIDPGNRRILTDHLVAAAAEVRDVVQRIATDFPRSALFILIATYLVLLVLLRSVVLPAKAIIVNGLSITASSSHCRSITSGVSMPPLFCTLARRGSM